MRGTTITHGVKLSLTVPGNVYPLNALVRVTIVMRPASPQPVLTDGAACTPNPTANVLSRAGEVIYPPVLAFPDYAPTSCPPAPPHPLRGGETLRTHEYVVLRGDRLNAVASLVTAGMAVEVRGRPVVLRLTRAKGPDVILHTGSQVYASVHPAGTVRGPLHFVDETKCAGGSNGVTAVSRLSWQVAVGRRLTPLWPEGCSGQREWHALAGWVNHPVVAINYAGTGSQPLLGASNARLRQDQTRSG